MSLEVGKTYHFEGKTHDTVYTVVSELPPDHVQVLILESAPLPGHGSDHKAGDLVKLNLESNWALKSVPL